MVPKKAFLTKGFGVHKDKLASFELALRAAKIEKFNLVSVSSILPPNCKIVPRNEGVKELLKAISQEMANNNKDVQEQTIKAISENTQTTKEMAQVMQELKDEIQALKQELSEMKAEPPEPEQKQGFFSKLFGKK